MKYVILLISLFLLVPQTVFAATADGSGPWADEVVSSSQGLMKDGQPIPELRSNPQSSLGEAEGDDSDGSFFSLGFGGSIVLKFENQFKDGVIVIEATTIDEFYPIENAFVEVSADGATWFTAGSVGQDGEVDYPVEVSCAQYIKITDTSDANKFIDESADAYDLDGVRVEGDESCQIVTPSPEPTTSPTPTPTSTPNPNPSSPPSNSTSNPSQPTCTETTPGTPTLSASRTTGTTANLTWNNISNATHYAISYGTSSGNYQYGVSDTGNTTTFSVGGLDPSTKYFFIVRAVNGCQPGSASNEVSVNPKGGGQVLGLTTDSTGKKTTGGRGQVLGLSTDALADTGNIFTLVRFIGAGLVTIISFYAAKKHFSKTI